jgi:penicillin-binding protein 1A
MSFHPRKPAAGLGPGHTGAALAARPRLLGGWPWEIRLVILAVIYLGPPAVLAIAAALVYYTVHIPNPMALPHKAHVSVVRVLARDGSLLSERGGADAYVPIDLLPRHLIDAVVATEDRRFFQHWGLDPSGMLRAAFANLRTGRLVQGGSTLTQQLAKNLFLGSERTVRRKLEELVLALWLELRLGKRNILELYLNRVYFGGGAYGVGTASERFFGKPAQHLTLAEAAVLAGLLKAPSKFSPAWNPAVARARARSVLALMVEAGFLSAQLGDAAARADIRFADSLQPGQSGLDYAVDAVLERLPPLVGSPTSEVIVETTINRDLQRRAQALVQETLAREGGQANASQAGLVLIDTHGGIQAVVGGRAYAESQFNRALKAKRQPGSAFKLFVYLAALESGLKPDSTVLDLPILGSGWSPRNEGAGYRGAVTLREGLAHSMNAVAARLHMSVGPQKTAAAARRLGIRSTLRADASLALGTSEVTLLELTAAYGVLARGGRALEPYLIQRVRTAAGQVLYQRPDESEKVLIAPPQVAALNDMLNAVLVSGTGRRAALARHPAAGKTGTTQDFRDAWFIGYTAHFVAGVWVGNDDGRAMNKVMGGGLPAKLWHDTMVMAHEGRAPAALPGTVQAASSTLAARGDRPAPEQPDDAPLMPRERIDAGFVERVIAAEAEQGEVAPSPPSADAWPSRRTWIGAAADRLRRGLGFGS